MPFRGGDKPYFCILGDALKCFEHQIELADIREIMLAAGGAGDIVFLDKIFHFFLRKSVDGLFESFARLFAVILDKLVCAEALLTFAAVHERVGKAAEVTRSNPCLRIHENGRIKTYIVGAFGDEFLPPCFLDIVFSSTPRGP